MTVVYHPEFATDINRFAAGYLEISPALAARFRAAVDAALLAVIANPSAAGHFLNTGSTLLREVRRRNLETLPFFLLYSLADDRLVFGFLVPSASNPFNWHKRLG